ncbi:hypothetical protein KY311_05050 [Candidatus Woesearchaeota archaeon]|nr:hypothetical protein [Candidatus Woesearchaeota archaeon]
MNKKAQGLSVSTIVIAALAVLVLVVLAVIFAGRIGVFTKEVTVSCAAQGGICKATCDQTTEVQVFRTPDNAEITCPNENAAKCCMTKTIAEQRGFK